MADLTIDDLLNSLEAPDPNYKNLINNKDTWSRIGEKDSFSELNLDATELEEFLKEWIENNPYNS